MNNNIILIIGAILIVGIILSLVKKVFKLAIVIAIVGVLLSGNFAVGKIIEEKVKNINISSIEEIKSEIPNFLNKFVNVEKSGDTTKVNIDLFLYEKTIEIK
ncbi:hypothetical protein H9660_06600 [Clostridium sp. Sa3CUN1]|uniref:Uncharacterized protein n=1 Tax=Clostridium gallinarum TaxID=2762246 RepID=A0ABR8Q317_9CLOT|nr:hypothetical protein [Clostridium gallinarum]MBD7914812.1 hypothetical protein [Clostridium gallinarum]